MFDDKILQAIREHAAAEFPKEACGLVVNGAYRPVENVHEEPLLHFKVAIKDYLQASKEGLEAIVHSHPQGENFPSEQDMITQIKSAVPWIIAPKDHPIFWFGDGVLIAPLEGRRFQCGVHDCVSLARDWYKLYTDITPPNCPRAHDWLKHRPDLMVTKWLECGFETVTDDYKIGDLCIISIGSEALSHCAVYVGNDMILHHLANRLSSSELIHRWEKHIMMRLRFHQ